MIVTEGESALLSAAIREAISQREAGLNIGSASAAGG